MLVMTISALAAAVLYGTGAAVEQRQAAAAPAASAGRARLLVQLARQPLWLLGLAAQAGGFAVHAVALHSGPLALVQVMVAGELIVAVVLVRLWSGRPLGAGAWAAALTVVGGIASFTVLTAPAGGHEPAPGPHAGLLLGVAAALTGGAAVAVATAGLRTSPLRQGRRRAVLLAVAAGLADACSAVVTMAFSHAVGHGAAALLTSWPLYALVVSGAGNVLLTQTAYQAGYPMITLPLISAVTPLTSAVIGIGALGEGPGRGLSGLVAAGLAVAVTSVALARLARAVPHQVPAPPASPPAAVPAQRPAAKPGPVYPAYLDPARRAGLVAHREPAPHGEPAGRAPARSAA